MSNNKQETNWGNAGKLNYIHIECRGSSLVVIIKAKYKKSPCKINI